MKKNYRIIPLWSLPFIALAACALVASGCKTGGKKISSGSSGIVRIIGADDLIKQPNGLHKIKPTYSEQVKLPSARSRPEPPPSISVEAIDVPLTPMVGAGKATPFTPTISETTRVKLPPIKSVQPISSSNVKEAPIKVSVNVIPNDPNPKAPSQNAGEEGAPAGGNKVKIKWLELGFFYLLVILACLGVWSIYDIHKIYKKNKQQKQTKRPQRRKRKPTKKKSS